MPGSVLRVISPGGEVRTVPLTGADLQIGSSIESSLVLAGNGVSGQHCRIELRGQKLTVVDRGSKNGTFVNSRRCVEPTEIHEGDRIGVGTYILEVAPQRAAAEARELAVPPAQALQLFQRLLDEPQLKTSPCYLTVNPANHAALGLYREFGFEPGEVIQGYYREDEPRLEMWRKAHV